mgnify:CR=1 FL=1
MRGERQLGRWGALTASTLLLLSPVFLYQSRYIRHDSFTVVGALLLFTSIVRYVERPSRGWLITMGATIGGNVRVGLEDSIYLGAGTLAKSNAEQVAKIRRILTELSLDVATPQEARQMLKLKGGDRVAF